MLQGHPDAKKILGIDVSTGSLGQGVSNAVVIALGLKYKGNKAKVYTILGDGELQGGLVWEAAMLASHYKLDNLVVIIDNNGLQIDEANGDVMVINQLDEKFKSFGFNVVTCNGHDFDEIHEAMNIIVTAEEHSVIGGLGAMVSQVVCSECPTKVKIVGIQDTFGESESLDELMKKYELTSTKIIEEVKKIIK